MLSPFRFCQQKVSRDIIFLQEASMNKPIQVKSTMVSTSLKALKVAPKTKMVGAGLENAATGSGMSERKKAASMLPPKPRTQTSTDVEAGSAVRSKTNRTLRQGPRGYPISPPLPGRRPAAGLKRHQGKRMPPTGEAGMETRSPRAM